MNKFKINLQLFAGEKTEKATPRRREEARKKGQVAKSNELVMVFVLTLTLLGLNSWLPSMLQEFDRFYHHVFIYTEADLTVSKAGMLISETIIVMARMVGPLLLVAMVAGYLANVMQIGFLFTTESFKLDFNRINPLKGLQRIFSKRAIAELIKSLLKTCLVGYIAFTYLYKQLPGISVLMDVPVTAALAVIGDNIFSASWRVLAVLFVLAVADFAYQNYEYEQSLKMSKQEIKEEYKNIEGDPLLRSKIRERQRLLASRRMMQEVPQATVVITNPRHFAVALKYEEDMSAPVVVAKGQDLMAEKIKEVAQKHEVPVVENVHLARALYRQVEVGMPIPVDLYQAVAEVIAYVYRLKKRV